MLLQNKGLTGVAAMVVAGVIALAGATANAQLENIDLSKINLDDIKVPDKSAEKPKPGANPAAGKSTAAADPSLDFDDKRFWQIHWHTFAKKFATDDGERYFLCPKYTYRYPSSLGMTEEQFTREHTEVERRKVSTTLIKNVTTKPTREEVVAAVNSIPDLAPGEYGHFHSAQVVEVINKNEMIVTDVWLVDARQIEKEIAAAEKKGDRLYAEEQARVRRLREQSRSRTSTSSRDRDRDRRTNSRADYDRANYGSRSDNNANATARFSKSDINDAIEQRYMHREELMKKQSKFRSSKLRLIGFDTRGAVAGKRWDGYRTQLNKGPKIVIPIDETSLAKGGADGKSRTTSYSRRRDLVAVNAELWNDATGLSEQQFIQLLENRGMSQAQFIDTARALMKEFGAEEAEPLVLRELANAKIESREGDADAPGEKGSSFLSKKYGSKDTGGGSAEGDKESFLEKKYGKKDGKSLLEKKYGDKGDKKSFFEKKYGNKDKDKGESAEKD